MPQFDNLEIIGTPAEQALSIVRAWRIVNGTDMTLRNYIAKAIEFAQKVKTKSIHQDVPTCPFCGKPPEPRVDYMSERVSCMTTGCALYLVAIPLNLWKTRVC